MKKHLSLFFMSVMLICVIFSVSSQTGEDAGKTYSGDFTLKIIETTDMHGSIFPYDFINDRPEATSLAQIMSYVKKERAKAGQQVLLLDNGDILQGQPVVYYSNTR